MAVVSGLAMIGIDTMVAARAMAIIAAGIKRRHSKICKRRKAIRCTRMAFALDGALQRFPACNKE
jgi:hypothetical protein